MINPLVSVCVSCYNHEEYLSDFFLCLLEQTYRNFEIIIVDDHSQDKSSKIIKEIIPEFIKQGINVIFKENDSNRGVSFTCNELIKLSNGEYIKFISSDDLLTRDCLEKMVKFVSSHENVNVLVGNLCAVENNYRYGEEYSRIKIMDIATIESYESIHDKLFESCFICSPGEFFSKKVFDKYGLFDEKLYYEDWDFFIRISKYEKIFFLDEIITLYRKSTTSLSNYNYAPSIEEEKSRFEKMYLGTRDLFRKHKKEISIEMWRQEFIKRYKIYIDEADRIGYYKYIKAIFKDMREDDVDVFSIRMKLSYILKHKIPMVFKLAKKVI